MRWARVVFAFLAGPLVSLGLFFGMSRLVALGNVRLQDDGERRRIEFVRLKREASEAKKKELKPQRTQVEPPPETPPLRPSTPSSNSGAIGVNIPMPSTSHRLQLQGGLSAGAVQDREAVPVVRVRPTYPASAAARGLEGHVTIRFTISPSGSVVDATVIDSAPPGVFDRAALKAIRRWRYDPKLVDGKPVARPNQKVTLTFELNEP